MTVKHDGVCLFDPPWLLTAALRTAGGVTREHWLEQGFNVVSSPFVKRGGKNPIHLVSIINCKWLQYVFIRFTPRLVDICGGLKGLIIVLEEITTKSDSLA